MSDWGQGSKNNNIGWGQGAVNNNISWGKSHELSYSGDTEIVGGLPLLLDLYPNAAAAYSLRRLNSDYTGDAIRVRRASDNTELNIGFVNNELDVASLETFCSGTDGFVTTWYDQGGENNDATQTTASSQPKIHDSVTGVILENGKPAVGFDGDNDNLINADFVKTTTLWSAYAVCLQKELGNQNILDQDQSSGTRIAQYLRTTHGGFSTIGFSGSAYQSESSGESPAIDKYLLLESYRRSNSLEIFSNNLSNGANSISVIQNTGALQLTIGSASGNIQYWNGTSQEIILYESDQFANRTPIKTNINDYYEIY